MLKGKNAKCVEHTASSLQGSVFVVSNLKGEIEDLHAEFEGLFSVHFPLCCNYIYLLTSFFLGIQSLFAIKT